MWTTDQSDDQLSEAAWFRSRRRRPLSLAVAATAIAQGILAVAIAVGGDPVIGLAAAAFIALCGFALVGAATLLADR